MLLFNAYYYHYYFNSTTNIIINNVFDENVTIIAQEHS